jgi:hypothetical protein
LIDVILSFTIGLAAENIVAIILLSNWLIQIVSTVVVFIFLRHQLCSYAFIAYEEHYKKLWITFAAITALSVF